jgi:hypothetical protein
MKIDLDKLEKLDREGSLAPWVEDDGNIFSSPLSRKRHQIIMKRVEGEDLPHPDEGKDHPLGFVGSVPQFTENFQQDLDLIVEARNSLPKLTQRIRELEAENLFLQGLKDEVKKVLEPFDKMDCGDNSCVFATNKTGMRTNGGCRCHDRPNFGSPVRQAVLRLRQKLKNT